MPPRSNIGRLQTARLRTMIEDGGWVRGVLSCQRLDAPAVAGTSSRLCWKTTHLMPRLADVLTLVMESDGIPATMRGVGRERCSGYGMSPHSLGFERQRASRPRCPTARRRSSVFVRWSSGVTINSSSPTLILSRPAG